VIAGRIPSTLTQAALAVFECEVLIGITGVRRESLRMSGDLIYIGKEAEPDNVLLRNVTLPVVRCRGMALASAGESQRRTINFGRRRITV